MTSSGSEEPHCPGLTDPHSTDAPDLMGSGHAFFSLASRIGRASNLSGLSDLPYS